MAPMFWMTFAMLDFRRRHFLLLAAVLLCVHPASAKEWAKKMFAVVEHDFGIVARGATAEFDFELQNIYEEDVHILSVRSSCGCATPSISDNDLKTWEKGKIHTTFNTRSFLGQKTATITVMIDKPFPAEVQLTVKGFIRQDVVFHPGAVEYGEINAGDSAQQTIAVNYAGRPDWSILKVETPGHLKARYREVQRTNGRVDYELQVQLSGDAPVGYVQDQVILITNDSQMQRIPLAVRGRVKPSVTVSPSSLALGILEPGERVTKQILVRAARPFTVTDVRCDGDCLSFESPRGAKTKHFIPVTFTAGDKAGDLAITIHIETDLGEGAVGHCIATATVREQADGS